MPKPIHPEGVPLDVWLCSQDAAPTGHALRAHLARRLIDAYSPPEGFVADLAPGRGEGTAAAIGAGRRCVPRVLALGRAGRGSAAPRAVIAVVADLVLALPPASHLAPLRPHTPCRPPAEATARRAAALLRPGGFLVLGTLGGSQAGDPVTAAVEAASEAGLAYFQHVVAVIPSDLDGTDDDAAGAERRLAHVDLVVFKRPAG